jgi:GTP 3',8-cyclase
MTRLASDKLRLIVTGKCNLDCFYCHNEGQEKEDTFLSEEGLAWLLPILRNNFAPLREVTISGGEPLMHPAIGNIVRQVSTVCGNVTMVTNGLLATEASLGTLMSAGLKKLRLGVDSLTPNKPRPSPGYLSEEFEVEGLVRAARALGLSVDVNVVVTKFNRNELGDLVSFAMRNGLSIKLFEHVDVDHYGANGSGGRMAARPHVPFAEVAKQIGNALGREVGDLFAGTEGFGEANLSMQVGDVEIRYCRYLCPFELCWLTGTRVDAAGYTYNCMANRGLDQLSLHADAGGASAIVARASGRRCRDENAA